MIFKCKNGIFIHFQIVRIDDENDDMDFFMSDLMGFLEHTLPKVNNIIYITDISVNSTENYKIYKDAIKEFTKRYPFSFIALRMGYDENESDTSLLDKYKKCLIDQYVAIMDSGFIDVSEISNFEFSRVFIFKNIISQKTLLYINKYKMTTWLKGIDFKFEDIFN